MSHVSLALSSPAVRSARLAIARALPHLSAHIVFTIAALAEDLAYGEDRGQWGLSAQQAKDLDGFTDDDGDDDDLTEGVR
jgi:hypothetical protein